MLGNSCDAREAILYSNLRLGHIEMKRGFGVEVGAMQLVSQSLALGIAVLPDYDRGVQPIPVGVLDDRADHGCSIVLVSFDVVVDIFSCGPWGEIPDGEWKVGVSGHLESV